MDAYETIYKLDFEIFIYKNSECSQKFKTEETELLKETPKTYKLGTYYEKMTCKKEELNHLAKSLVQDNDAVFKRVGFATKDNIEHLKAEFIKNAKSHFAAIRDRIDKALLEL